MPHVHITWLPKACRTAAARKEVAEAVIKAMTAVKSADISPDNLVVRFSESVGGHPLPKGYSAKCVRRALVAADQLQLAPSRCMTRPATIVPLTRGSRVSCVAARSCLLRTRARSEAARACSPPALPQHQAAP